jgi:hypothetical protein
MALDLGSVREYRSGSPRDTRMPETVIGSDAAKHVSGWTHFLASRFSIRISFSIDVA